MGVRGVARATVAVFLAVAVAVPAASLTAQRPASAAPTTPACPGGAADAVAASRAAAQCGGRVEVMAGRDEKTQVFANADGTFTEAVAAVTQRVRGADGGWTVPDPALHQAVDGGYAPAASALPMVFSGGGDATLVTLGRAGAQVHLRWPGRLPAPSVSGATATYPEVWPGVDLTLTAQIEGFAEVLVVKNATAAANPALAAVRFPATADGLSLRSGPNGALSAVDGHGTTVFGSGTPAMWDSTAPAQPSPGEPAPSPRSPSAHSGQAAMPLELSGSDIVVHPDLALLRGAGTRYPVYIDPGLGASAWTMINSAYPAQSYWSRDRQGCPAPYASIQCAKVGYTDEAVHMTYRSMFAFGFAGLQGKHVLDAKLSMDTVYSWTNTNYDTTVHIVGAVGSGTTWTNHAGTWQGATATAKSHANDRVRRRTEWGVTSAAQTAVAARWPALTLGLKAANESSHNYWKKFDAGTALLTVTVNSYPNAPDQLSVDGNACVTGAARPFVHTVTPQLRARATDPDGAARLLTVSFYWWLLSGGVRNETDKVAQASIASGAQAVASIPAGRLSDGATYVVQTIGYDGVDKGQFSTTCEFTVDASPPPAPGAVSSVEYPSDAQRHGGAGVAGTFVLSPPAAVPADFAGYAYTLDPGVQPAAATQVTANTTDHKATVVVTPPTDGAQTLRVWSRDTAGNFSGTALAYPFVVQAGAGPDGSWSFDEGTGSIAADGTGHGNTATLTNAGWAASRGGAGKALSAGTGWAATAGPVATRSPVDGSATTVDTAGNFTVSAWVKLAAAGTGRATAVAADGAHTSAFTLGFDGIAGKWCFAMAPSDTNGPSLVNVRSDAAAPVGVWAHLAGSYDASTHTMHLFVNGVQQTQSTVLFGFNATGGLTIGRGKWQSNLSDPFNGAIDDVRIYARVLSATDPELLNALRPEKPQISFPDGPSAPVGQPLRVTLSGGGDPRVTTVKYGLGSASAATTAVTLPTPGGQATVTVTRSLPGTTYLYAVAVDAAGLQSDSAAAAVSFMRPGLSGIVVDAATGTPVAGAVVHLDPGDVSQTTDAAGAYSFPDVAADTYTVSAVAASSVCGLYASTAVTVEDATALTLSLAPQSDMFGYTCATAVNRPFISAGTVLGLTGDDAHQAVSLPFPVSFYGNSYSTGWVSTNGLVSFADPGDSDLAVPGSIPDTGAPNALVAPFWDDLDLDAQSSVRTQTLGTAPNRQFVVEWRDASFFTEPTDHSRRITFEAVFAEGGGVSFNYAGLDDDVERGAGAAVGIESPGGVYGLQYSFQTPSLSNGTAVVYTYPVDARPLPLWTVAGTVTQGGTPAAGVPVTLVPREATVMTDSAGHYQFANLEPDGYTIAANDGCQAASTDVDLAGNATVNLALTAVADAFGHSCTTAAPAFAPADTTVLPLTGDDAETTVTLPFPVPFYGQSYSSAWVSTNGFVSFTDPAGAVVDDRGALPSGAPPNAAVYGYWDDLLVDASSSVRTTTVGSAPNRQFIVEWRNVAFFDRPGLRITFEIAFAENGTINVTYRDLDDPGELGATTVVGIENAPGDDGFTYSAFLPVLADGKAIVFHPPTP